MSPVTIISAPEFSTKAKIGVGTRVRVWATMRQERDVSPGWRDRITRWVWKVSVVPRVGVVVGRRVVRDTQRVHNGEDAQAGYKVLGSHTLMLVAFGLHVRHQYARVEHLEVLDADGNSLSRLDGGK